MPGYWEHLEKRFSEMSAKGEAEERFYGDFKHNVPRDVSYGTEPITEDLLPKDIALAKPYKVLGDIIRFRMGIAVTARTRALIEEREPDRHQFAPLKITLPSGQPFPADYYILRGLTELDAWDPEQSDPGCFKRSVRIMKMRAPLAEYSQGIAMKRSGIKDHHIWHGFVSPVSGISGFGYYISDNLKDAIRDAGLKTPDIVRLKEA